jgi:hypothetical protein
MRERIAFQTNVPVTVALAYADGLQVEGRFGDQIMYTLADERVMLPSKESQRGYQHAIDEFITWCCSEPRLSFNKAVVTRYRINLESRQLAPGTISGRLAAVSRVAYKPPIPAC